MIAFFKRNASTILSCVGGVGVIATAILAVKATPKAYERIEKAKKEKGEELTKFETVKAAAPSYISTVAVGVGTIVCIFGANVLNKRQQASLISAYALLDKSYKQYRNKVIELYGKEADEKVINAIAIETAEEQHINASCFGTYCDMSSEDYSDPVLFYDEFTDRYFEAPMEQVMLAEYHLNRNFILRGYVTLNEFYEFLGLEQTEYGDAVGWTPEDGLLWIDFNHRHVVLDDGLECYIIETPWDPSPDFLEYYY